jgi:glycosyltransferase involved in cell wall biosynthesis
MHQINKNSPLVTVITPAFNRASYLDETILSVLSQDYPHLEYIVLDDGSTDDTLKVIRKYEDRIRWDTHKNMGETRTVNKGFSMAKGEIIGVVNSDDPLLPDSIRKIVKFMAAREELVVVYPDWDMIDSQGEIVKHFKAFEYRYVDMIRKHFCLPGPGAFFRRAVVDQLKGRDPQFRYVADLDFWFRAGLLGPFMRIPETLATFRVHAHSATVSHKGTAMADEHITLIEKFYSFPDIPETVLKVRKEAYSSANYVAGCACGKRAVFAKAKYFFKALSWAPLKYFGEYRKRLLVMLLSLFGISDIQFYLFLKRFR